jgi:bacteriocin-like protein
MYRENESEALRELTDQELRHVTGGDGIPVQILKPATDDPNGDSDFVAERYGTRG